MTIDDNLLLSYLKDIRADVHEVKLRLTQLEGSVASLRRDIGSLAVDIARQQVAIDRLADRVERIEQHLRLGDPA